MSTWRRFSITLQRFSTGRGVLIAGMIFVLFTALTLPGQTAEAERMAQGAGVPDTSLWYTPADLTAMAESYGPVGRQAYLQARWTLDLIFPLAYTAFLVTAIGWLARRISGPSDRWQMANLLPVLGMALDYLENIAASIVMARYPAPSPVAVHLAPIFTLLKWVCAGGELHAPAGTRARRPLAPTSQPHPNLKTRERKAITGSPKENGPACCRAV